MAWFIFYRKWDPQLGKYIFDEQRKVADDILEQEWRNNRGKYVAAYDDITGNPLSARELKELEDEREEMMTPQIIIPDETGIVRRGTFKTNRKYKPRKVISKELRMAVYQLHDSRCSRCQGEHANQIHHIDLDPSNNNIKNLQLLCYDCHLTIEGKEKFRIA
jgi:5-methylcytosine-specific restriction endonuclease McrA